MNFAWFISLCTCNQLEVYDNVKQPTAVNQWTNCLNIIHSHHCCIYNTINLLWVSAFNSLQATKDSQSISTNCGFHRHIQVAELSLTMSVRGKIAFIEDLFQWERINFRSKQSGKSTEVSIKLAIELMSNIFALHAIKYMLVWATSDYD
jgi:hypothetical protein